MKLSTKVHGYLDYLVGGLLIASPWIFGFNRGGAETWVPILLGASAILYSLFTDYELGVTSGISMRTHLVLDFLNGLILALSPWIFGFSDFVFLPHLVLGIMEIGVVMVTSRQPDYGPRHKATDHSSSLHV